MVNLLLFVRVTAEVFVAILAIQHRLFVTAVGGHARGETFHIARPTPSRLIPHSAFSVLPGLLGKDVDRFAITEEFADAPRWSDRRARRISLATCGDNGMDCNEVLPRIVSLDEAGGLPGPIHIGGIVEAVLAVGMRFVLVGYGPEEDVIKGRVPRDEIAEPKALALR